MEGKCRTENIIYKCIASTSGHPDKVYLGTAEGDFKKRYYNHISSFKNEIEMNKTSLAKYVWEQKERHNVTPSLKWYIVKSVAYYSNTTKSCILEDQNLFLNVVILISIYCPSIKLMIDIPFNTFRIIA